jgi:hypothetical protein
MPLICLSCALWLPALLGLGLPLSGLLDLAARRRVPGVALRALLDACCGIFTMATLAAALGLVLPVYPLLSTALLSGGWLLAIRSRRRWTGAPARAWRCLAIVAAIVLLADARGIPCYDTGLYHLQAVRWITNGPTPRGLANLFGPLGSNSAWFAFAAALETPGLLGRSCFIANALLAILTATAAMDAALQLRRGSGTTRAARLILALMLIPLATFGIYWALISSLSPDLAVMLLVMLATALWIASPAFSPHVLVLACLATAIKPSAAPLLLGAAAAMVFWMARHHGSLRWRPTLGAIAACLVAGAVFVARGLWTSGWVAFPFPLGSITRLRWTTPDTYRQTVALRIELWAKFHALPGQVAPGQRWGMLWIQRFGLSQPMGFVLTTLAAGLVLLAWKRGAWPSKSTTRRIAAAALLHVAAIGLWIAQAPDLRFGYGYLISLAALPLAIVCGGQRRLHSPPSTGRAVWIGPLAGLCLLLLVRLDRHLLKAARLGWPTIPHSRFTLAHTADGTSIHIPVPPEDRVWDQPALATPELLPGLHCEHDSAGGIREFWIAPPPK